ETQSREPAPRRSPTLRSRNKPRGNRVVFCSQRFAKPDALALERTQQCSAWGARRRVLLHCLSAFGIELTFEVEQDSHLVKMIHRVLPAAAPSSPEAPLPANTSRN